MNNSTVTLHDLKILCDYNKYDFKWENSRNDVKIIVTIPDTNEELIEIGKGELKTEKKENAVRNFINKYKELLNIDKYLQYRAQKKENSRLPFHKNRYIIHAKKELRNVRIHVNYPDYLNYLGNTIAIDAEGAAPNMIQLSDGIIVLVFNYQMYKDIINKYLNQTNKTLIFCDAESDIKLLKITNTNYYDIQQMWKSCRNSGIALPNITNLKAMASHINNIKPVLLRPKSNFYWPDNVRWSMPYDDDHLYYAAYDVFVTFQIYEYLTKLQNGN